MAIESVHKIGTSKIVVAKWIGYLALIDLLVLPYFQVIIFPYSLPLIAISFVLLDVKIKRDYYRQLYLIIAGAVFSSVVISMFLPPYSEFIIDNLKYAIQLLSSFIYFFYFRWLAKKIQLNIMPILIIFVVWFVFLGIQFLNAPLETNGFITSLYGRQVNTEKAILEDFRYSYFFSDPNTGIYFFLIALAPLLMSAKNTIYLLLFLTVGALMVLLSQSSGGLIAYCLMVFILLFGENLQSFMSVNKLLKILLVVGALFGFYLYFNNLMQDNAIIEFAIQRLFGANERYMEGGGRFNRWSDVYKYLLPLPLGRGYTLYNDGFIKAPHSDFLGLLYRYGYISLIAALLFLFGKYKKVAPLLVPAAMAFAINSLLDDSKIFSLFLSLLAIGITVTNSQKSEVI